MNWKNAFIASGLFFGMSVTPTFAHYLSSGYSLYQMNYNSIDGPYADYLFSQATQNWTNAVATSFTETSYTSNTVRRADLADTWYGLYSPTGSPTSYFTIWVNSRTLAEDFPNNTYTAELSTATHEFGHAQYLADLESGWGNSSIMSYERDRTQITTPQQHDIDDIKSYRGQ